VNKGILCYTTNGNINEDDHLNAKPIILKCRQPTQIKDLLHAAFDVFENVKKTQEN
jgi:hypothetical protein